MVYFSLAYRASKNVPRCILLPYQRIRTLTNSDHLRINDFSRTSHDGEIDDRSLRTIEDTFDKDNIDPTDLFRSVAVVKPNTFRKFFYNKLKLKFVDEEDHSRKPGTELLRNIAAKYDYWLVRKNQAHLLYYRLELMLQRLAYLKTIGLDPGQKLRLIQKSPPALLFTFSNCSFSGKLVYLRGLVLQDDGTSCMYMHVYYPVSDKLIADKRFIQARLKNVEDELKIKQPAAIRELLNIPCFFMDPSVLKYLSHMFVHKRSMPHYFDADKHTIHMLPPLCQITGLGISTEKHLSNMASNDVIASLPTYKTDKILDLWYPTNNGKGTAECLSTFLIRADWEEEKDRTGGQPVRKSKKGFNVKPRQY